MQGLGSAAYLLLDSCTQQLQFVDVPCAGQLPPPARLTIQARKLLLLLLLPVDAAVCAALICGAADACAVLLAAAVRRWASRQPQSCGPHPRPLAGWHSSPCGCPASSCRAGCSHAPRLLHLLAAVPGMKDVVEAHLQHNETLASGSMHANRTTPDITDRVLRSDGTCGL
jgi:hypothetical protein